MTSHGCQGLTSTMTSLDQLYAKLHKIDGKIRRASSGLEHNALLIERRDLEEKIWELDKTLEER